MTKIGRDPYFPECSRFTDEQYKELAKAQKEGNLPKLVGRYSVACLRFEKNHIPEDINRSHLLGEAIQSIEGRRSPSPESDSEK